MINEEKLNSNSFFESVAHHNLERFHSETIAWIFNTFPDAAKNFIKSIHDGIASTEDIILNNKKCCWAESDQIDILLEYSYKEKNYQIIIENKMKASEHKIEAQKLLKKAKSNLENPFDEYNPQLTPQEIKFLNFNQEVKLSQTEYYYLREKMERKKNIENCWYVYLKPSRINDTHEYFTNKIKKDLKSVNYYFDKLNTWNKKLGMNPWLTITYTQLINTIQKSGAIEKSEKAFERYSKLKIEKKCVEDIIIANSYINFIQDKIDEKVKLDEFNQNEDYARFDYFKLLFALVKSKFKDVSILNSLSDNNEENSIYEYIEAGSSNGGMPLFAFYKKIKLPIDDKFDFFKPKRESELINIGIQIQGENFKYYASADTNDYDNTVVNTSKTNNNYGDFVKHVLNQITKDWESKNEKIFATDKGFHPNKTKTFYSRSYKIKNFIASEIVSEKNKIDQPRDIFSVANEISEKVNHFVNFDISDSINSYKI